MKSRNDMLDFERVKFLISAPGNLVAEYEDDSDKIWATPVVGIAVFRDGSVAGLIADCDGISRADTCSNFAGYFYERDVAKDNGRRRKKKGRDKL